MLAEKNGRDRNTELKEHSNIFGDSAPRNDHVLRKLVFPINWRYTGGNSSGGSSDEIERARPGIDPR